MNKREKKAFDKLHTTRIGGRTYIDEEGAEVRYGLPRELLQMWAGLPIAVPQSAAERRVRRGVLLAHYRELASGVAPCMLVHGTEHHATELVCVFSQGFCEDFKAVPQGPPRGQLTSAQKLQIHRIQTLAAVVKLCEPDGVWNGDDSLAFLAVLESDLRASREGN